MEVVFMSIRPISDLRNYPNMLEDISKGNHVYLTKNGRESYVIMDITEFEEHTKEKATLQLLLELNKVENAKTISIEEVINRFKEKKQ